MPFKAVEKSTASRMVVEQILDSLKAGEFKLGEKLPSQKDLADLFGVGRSSVREAIKALDTMKYLDVIQGKGTFFKKDIPSDDQSLTNLKNALDSVAFSDLMEARVILESNAVELAAASADPKHIHGLQESVKKLQESEEDREKFIKIDLAFHLALAEATNNIVIYEMMKLLLERVHNHHLVYFGISSEMREKTILTANQILSYIIKAEGKKGAACMRRHLSLVKEVLVRKGCENENRIYRNRRYHDGDG
jgi:GntR family transcriptional repressor for pyruvate dehydrogenase complex